MKKHYVKAVIELLLQGKKVDTVLKNLQSTLVAKGHQSIHADILKGVIKQLQQTEKSEATSITVAYQADVSALKQEIETAVLKLQGTVDESNVTIDTSLIGGYVATFNGKKIDASHKHKLVTLYKAITA